jgi:autotransporter-associated beta strand protein
MKYPYRKLRDPRTGLWGGQPRALAFEQLEHRRLLTISINSIVWNDASDSGVYQAGEAGVAGVTVQLYSTTTGTNSGGTLVSATTTTSTGSYSFTGLTAGTSYYLVFCPPAGFAFSPQGVGADDTVSSAPNSAGVTNLFTEAANETDNTQNAGLYGSEPTFGYAISAGGLSSDQGDAIAVDSSGNVYVTGSFSGTADFETSPATYDLTSTGYTDAFVAKYSPLGALVWAENFGGQYDYDYGLGIAVDSSNNVYVTGYFSGTATFASGVSLTAAGVDDAFVAKLSSAGAVSWAKGIGGTSSTAPPVSGYDYGRGIAVNSTGIFLTGAFYGTAYFDTTARTVTLTSTAGYFDAYVAEISSSGTFQWAKTIGLGDANNVEPYGIAVDSGVSSNVYTTGYFSGTANFNPAGSNTLTSAGGTDVYVSKLSSTGTYVWAGDLGGSGNDSGAGIAVDSSGNIYTTGYFNGTANFNPGGSTTLTSNGGADAFVSKLSSTGAYVWAEKLGGSGNDYGAGIAVDSNDNVYTTGSFTGTANFNPGGIFDLTSAAGSYANIFLSKLSSAGAFVWVCSMGGTESAAPLGMALGSDGSLFATGYFYGTADFDPRYSTFDLTAAGDPGIFVDRLLPQTAPTAVTLSVGSVAEAQPAGTPVGLLSSTDADSGDDFTYTLVGGTDEADFTIAGIELQTNAVLSYATKSSYSIVVQTTDIFGLSFQQTLTITLVKTANACSIGGVVWNDANANGLLDSGETDIANATVDLYVSTDTTIGNSDDFLRATATTTSSGAYSFGGLVAVPYYYLVFHTPSGYAFTTEGVDANPAVNSSANSSGVTALITLTAGENDSSVNAGLVGAAPVYGFTETAGGSSYDQGVAVTTDSSGNVYVTGAYYGTVDFDSGPAVYDLVSLGSYDAFVAKYTPAGALVWAKGFDGYSTSIGSGIAVDSSGNVYVTGYFSGTVNFNPGPGVDDVTSYGGNDGFIVKLTSSGSFGWVNILGGAGDDKSYAIAVDSASAGNNVYLTGYFSGLANFGSTALTGAGNDDGFACKLNTYGAFQWAKDFGGAEDDRGAGIAVDSSSNVYITGYFASAATFGSTVLSAASGNDAFVSKLSTAGAFAWSVSLGGSGNVEGYGIVVDPTGNYVYTTGYFSGTANFNPGGTFNLTSEASEDIYVSKLTTAGGAYAWAGEMGGASGTSQDFGSGIAVDSAGNVYVSGGFEGTANFNPGGTFNLTSANGYEAFVCELGSAGAFDWAYGLGGTSNVEGSAIAIDGSGNILTTGFYEGTAQFDPFFASASATSNGGADMFLSRIEALPAAMTIPTASGGNIIRMVRDVTTTTNVDIFVNASGSTPTYSVPLADVSQWIVNGGATADQLTIDFSNGSPLPSGGLTFNGGTATGNLLSINSNSGSVTATATQVTVGSFAPITYRNVNYFIFDSGAALTVSGAAIDLNGASQTLGSFIISSGSILDGTLVSSTYGVQGGTISANLAGTGTLTKTGSGTATLSGTNTYTGATAINAGTLLTDTAGIYGSSTTNGLSFGGGTLKALDSSGISTSKAVTASSAILLDTSNGPITLTGNIAGAAGLTLSGASTLALGGTNSYTGPTTINGGVLSLASAGAMPSGSSLVFGGGTLQFTAGNTTDVSGRISGSTGPISIDTGSQTVTFGSALAATNTGGLAKIGSGTLTLSGSNAYAGVTAINAGVLSLASAGAVPGGSSLIFGGGTLQFTASNTVDFSGRIADSASPISIDTGSQTVTFASALAATNTGGLTKIGTGTLILSGNNGYSGATTINAGVLEADTAGIDGSSAASGITLAGGTLKALDSAGINTAKPLAATSTILLDTTNGPITLGGNIASTTSGLTLSGANALTLSGTNSFTGAIAINGGTLVSDTAGIDGSSTSGGITFAGGRFKTLDSAGISTTKPLAATGTILLDTTNGPITLGGNVASTTSGLTLSGANALTLSGTNNFTGAITINGGTLVCDTAGIDGANTTNGISFAGGTLKALDSGGISTNKALTATSTVLLDTTNGPITLGGSIASTTAGLTLSGANVLTLSGANKYTGTTILYGGTLVTDTAGINGTSATNGIFFADGALKVLDSGGIKTNKAIFAITLPLNTANGPITLGGNISGTGSGLTLTGAKALTLSGTNSFTGGTVVQQGTLLITSAAAFPANTSLIVGSGAQTLFSPAAASSQALGSASSVNAAASPITSGQGYRFAPVVVGLSIGPNLPFLDPANVTARQAKAHDEVLRSLF